MALTILLPFFFIAISSADIILENPDFESPPTNITSNSTSPFLLQAKVNTIPGWSFDGTVHYITSGPNISLPGNGHGIQLGRDGKINQTFRPHGGRMEYVVTFSLAPGNMNCLNKNIAVNISDGRRSKVFSLQRGYGKEMWESHAYYTAVSSEKPYHINLKIQSAAIDMDANDTCYPIVDTFMIREMEDPSWYDANILYNGGFEMGPAFVKNSTEGILLNDEPDGNYGYTIDQWSVIGTIKYINSEYYSVPEGKAAIELVSDFPSGIERKLYLTVGYNYTLSFTIGDANNSCLGELTVYVQVENDVNNFTMISNGKGLAKNYSLTFVAKLAVTSLRFLSSNQSKSSDNVTCGPVIDNIILPYSDRSGKNKKNAFILPYVIFIIALHLFV